MRVKVLGGGWYGCHIASTLKNSGYEVELHERADRLFSGASGGNPARLHLGFHYPRSGLTRAACQETHKPFMRKYGFLTKAIPTNIYAVAQDASKVDFRTYVKVLRGEVEFIELEQPQDFGLANVEGALLTGERHILINAVRKFFTATLDGLVRYNSPPADAELDDPAFDWTIDCTFCARVPVRVERYEPCVTGLLEGPIDRAVTIMDGPFPSLYPWDEAEGLCSITSAEWTPIAKVATYAQARELLDNTSSDEVWLRIEEMRSDLRRYWPASWDLYKPRDYRLSIRAMPQSGAAARLVEVEQSSPRTLHVRAGKIDAVFLAEDLIRERLQCLQ